MKFIVKVVPALLAVLGTGACSTGPDAAVQRYEQQVIEQVILNTDSSYTIQIGMMAQAFHLEKTHEDLDRQVHLLRESLEQRNTVNVEVEKGTARIRRVEK